MLSAPKTFVTPSATIPPSLVPITERKKSGRFPPYTFSKPDCASTLVRTKQIRVRVVKMWYIVRLKVGNRFFIVMVKASKCTANFVEKFFHGIQNRERYTWRGAGACR